MPWYTLQARAVPGHCSLLAIARARHTAAWGVAAIVPRRAARARVPAVTRKGRLKLRLMQQASEAGYSPKLHDLERVLVGADHAGGAEARLDLGRHLTISRRGQSLRAHLPP